MCPWISAHFPPYYSDIPRFSKSLLLLLIFSVNSIVNNHFLNVIDNLSEVYTFKFVSIELVLFASFLSTFVSIVVWAIYRNLYHITWLFKQELKHLRSKSEMHEIKQKRIIDQEVYFKKSFEQLVNDIMQYQANKLNSNDANRLKVDSEENVFSRNKPLKPWNGIISPLIYHFF